MAGVRGVRIPAALTEHSACASLAFSWPRDLACAGMLDVQQIFGRAGRPQFEDEGLGIIITQHAQLAHYLGMLTHQAPIESKFTGPLVDNLNAEIVLGETS